MRPPASGAAACPLRVPARQPSQVLIAPDSQKSLRRDRFARPRLEAQFQIPGLRFCLYGDVCSKPHGDAKFCRAHLPGLMGLKTPTEIRGRLDVDVAVAELE